MSNERIGVGDALYTGWLRKWLAPADADKACSLRALSDAELVGWLSQRS